MALSYKLGYQESISVHPTRRQTFAGKPYLTFLNIWDRVVSTNHCIAVPAHPKRLLWPTSTWREQEFVISALKTWWKTITLKRFKGLQYPFPFCFLLLFTYLHLLFRNCASVLINPSKLPYLADFYCSLWSLYLSAVFHNKSTMEIWGKYSRTIS